MSTIQNEPGRLRPGMGPQADETRRPRHFLRAGRLSLRLVLALTALAVFASPFTVAFYIHYRAQWIGPQLDTPPARLPFRELSQFRRASLAATHAPQPEPIVLAYHDIAWASKSQYVVTPAEFEAQMTMLRAAGYHTLTAEQLVHYLHGGAAPTRSVAITFDDGTRGLWSYADKILERHHFHGISFLITSAVGTHQPYYLTWQEIQRMYSSGRWDFESHTDDLHQNVPVNASGRLGDPLTRLIWLASRHRQESMSEFRTRVRNDLDDSITDLTENHLPRPSLFAYPFSDSLAAAPYSAGAHANHLIHRLFPGAMTNYIEPAVPLSRREAHSGLVSRLEATSADTAATLFSRLGEIASLPVADTSGFNNRARWEAKDGKTASIAIVGRDVIFKRGHARWAYAAYAPGATADWDGYRISAKITNLNYQANPSATISVRLGSRSQLSVSVANHYMEVRVGSVRNRVAVLRKDLPAASAHLLTIRVQPEITVVSIDGLTAAVLPAVMKHRVTPGFSITGGFALSGSRPDPNRPFARFSGITLRRLAS